MADKAKHAFGALERVDESIASGVLDAYDILFVKDENGRPYVGWIDKEGNKVIVDNKVDLSGVEAELATKANASDVKALGVELATKADAEEVDARIAAAMNEHLSKKYEITSVPEGTLIDYREKEIRVMCPADAMWTKQTVGAGGDANCYYMTFKTYSPENAVGYIEHLNGQSDSEILSSFSTDEHGRRYQPTWLALAKHDATTDTWTYYGASSSVNKYIGWDYQIDWYDANGEMIASDCIRINLSNEDCHSEIKPYYWNELNAELNAKINAIENKIEEVSCEVIEF